MEIAVDLRPLRSCVALAGWLVLASACAAEAPTGPQALYVLVEPEELAELREVVPAYTIEPRTVETVRVSPLVTEHFTFHTGIAPSSSFGAAPPFEPDFLVEERGILPLDHPSLVAFTAALNLERAYAFFEDLGLGTTFPARDRPYPVLLYARIGDAPVYPLAVDASDNAAFAGDGENQAFLVMPNRILSDVDIPFAASRFVMTHEFSHAVFHHVVGDVRDASPFSRALNEGLADTFALGATLEWEAFHRTIGPGASSYRDPRTRQTWSIEDDVAAIEGDPYLLGAVVASTFYAFAELTVAAESTIERRMHEVARQVFEALVTWSPVPGAHPVHFLRHVIQSMPEGAERDLLCDLTLNAWGDAATEWTETRADELCLGSPQVRMR